MRYLAAFLIAATPAQAWEFSPTPVCTISETDGDMTVEVTYDPRQDQAYAIAMSGTQWPAGPVFAIQFGPPGGGLLITTDRHRLSPDGTTLSVSDRGFGNVLNGLASFDTAYFALGETVRAVPLDSAEKAVEAFRACIAAPLS
ncbi:excinuclease ABC subunit B [Alphaproteobacteria bacterium GH1-50]|uniref:Excinuclease ABC subunit B n=1 Tax=Kangsaoukella pontilimi TaxID=2691042 RepID=A0A7C9MC29_9RHOB|nr:excinuclease ABC subunit B [Kangsaoukella pontilimi]MXQ09113.1 excinuclease ABC subunit B [Kangsaoukella pontilimi]